MDLSDPRWAKRLKGWELSDGLIKTFNLVNCDVIPCEHFIAIALRYVTTQEQLDQVKKGEAKATGLQLAANPVLARKLGEALIKYAAVMEAEVPPHEKQN